MDMFLSLQQHWMYFGRICHTTCVFKVINVLQNKTHTNAVSLFLQNGKKKKGEWNVLLAISVQGIK